MSEPNWKHDRLSTCVPHIYRADPVRKKYMVPLCNSSQLTKCEYLRAPDEVEIGWACKRCKRIWEKGEKQRAYRAGEESFSHEGDNDKLPNPYTPNTEEHAAWDQGYMDADAVEDGGF